MTVTMFGYLILISIGFYDLFSPFSPESFSFFLQNLSITQDSV